MIPSQDDDYISITDAAKRVGVSRQAINQACLDGSISRKQIGKRFLVSLAEVQKFRSLSCQPAGAAIDASPINTGETYADYKQRKIAADAKLKELELMIRSGDLIKRADMLEAHSNHLSWLTFAFQNFGQKTATALTNYTDKVLIAHIIQEELNGILRKYTESLEHVRDDLSEQE